MPRGGATGSEAPRRAKATGGRRFGLGGPVTSALGFPRFQWRVPMSRISPVAASPILAAALCLFALPMAAETMKDMFPSYTDWVNPGMADKFGALEIHRGPQVMAAGEYTLQVGDGYYVLSGDDARWVLADLWQNLPDPDLQALIFQDGTSPLDDAWASTVYYYEDGHISDEEADQMDYQAIITARKAAEPELNRQRREAGLPELTTIGLTGTPGYDRASRSLTFSVLLQSANGSQTLNANAWVLSRHGYVNLNVLGLPEQAGDVNARMPQLIGMVSLADGNRYADYAPGVDAVAEGGLSGLLGGGAAQAGLVLVALTLLKKFGVVLAVPVIWLVKRLRGKSAGS
ncbi:MAG: DUF2167 domain-containing protein [Acetobacteraceae bacterium]|nr:MAG: DUF2167 domain-containing protein [Acetobacteraceae bacterium]